MHVYNVFPVVNHLLVSHCRRLPVVYYINYDIIILSFFPHYPPQRKPALLVKIN